MYATLIFGAIALAALGFVIANPSNWPAWIILVFFAWLTWPAKRKPGIRDYHSKRTLPRSSLPAVKLPEEAARAPARSGKGLL
jgi:hypothetical protein